MLLCIRTNTFPPLHLHTWVRALGPQQLTFSNTVLSSHTHPFPGWGDLFKSLCASCCLPTQVPLISTPQAAIMSSPWLSTAARPTASRTGHRRMNGRFGALRCGVCISNPSNLEVGEVDTAGFQSSTPRPTGKEYVWLLRPLALPF